MRDTLLRLVVVVLTLTVMGQPGPSVAQEEDCTPDGKFTSHVIMPDLSDLALAGPFDITWEILNTGDCLWDSGYSLVRTDSSVEDGTSKRAIPEVLHPGGSTRVTFSMVMPDLKTMLSGPQQFCWQMHDASGVKFGPNACMNLSAKQKESPLLLDSAGDEPIARFVEAACQNNASFLTDVTIPDDTVMQPGEAFVKTWRLENTGACKWNTHYSLAHVGEETFEAHAQRALDDVVASGHTAEISINMQAPGDAGSHTSWWQMQDDRGNVFGDKVYVRVLVQTPEAARSSESLLTEDSHPNVPAILGTSVARAEAAFGEPLEVSKMPASSLEHLPDGGQSRAYQSGQYTFYVDFDANGIARGFQVTAGLSQENHWLDEWKTLLLKFGLDVTRRPDMEARAALVWHDFQGYEIRVQTAGINKPVATVSVVEIPSGTRTPTPVPTKRPQPTLKASGILMTGSEGRLYADSGSVPLAVDRESLEHLVKALIIADEMGFLELILAGRAFIADNNTRVKIIDETFTTFRVRILEGERIGQTGWVPVEYVK